MRISKILFALLCLPVLHFAQSDSVSETKQAETSIVQFSDVVEDTTGINKLLTLCTQNFNSDIKLAQRYASQAREMSEKIQYEKGIAYSNYYLAMVFVGYDIELSEALLIDALKSAEKTGDELLLGKIYNIAGYLKNNINDFTAALDFFDRSLSIFKKLENDSMAAPVYNNIAISYKGLGNYEQAIQNYFNAVEINKVTGNFTWLATNYYNIGYSYIQLGDFENGLKYLKESELLAEEKNITSLHPYLWGAFGKYYFEIENYKLALEFGHKSFSESKQHLNRIEERFALNLITDIQVKTGHLDSAYYYQKAVIAINDSINQENQAKQLDFLEMKYRFQEELAHHQLKINLMEVEMEKRRIRRNYIILIAFLVLIGIVVILRNRIRQKTLQQKNLMLDKERLSEQIEFKNKELATNVLYLLNKNELIVSLEKKISSMKFDEGDPNKEKYNDIMAELKKNLIHKTWKEFEVRFHEVHSDFYNRLNQKYPDLSMNERRLSAFLKLNMTTKEISAITFQSVESLKMARHRLRKKLGLNRDDNLVAFLNSI